MSKPNVYEEITNQIIAKLEQGTIPWHKPWKSSAHRPKNLISQEPYSGINAFITHLQNYSCPYWLTYKQAESLGGNIKRGEKGTKIVYWSRIQRESVSDSGEIQDDSFSFLKTFVVFNFEQTEGIDLKKAWILPEDKRTEIEKLAECEAIIEAFTDKPTIDQRDSDQACYSPVLDMVRMPLQSRFTSDQEYYSVLFHELTHSTGHKNRLNRKGFMETVAFGSQDYSFEELVAEFGAAFLCGQAGIVPKTIDNSAAYIQSWLKVLKKDSKMLVKAAGQASKAADYILGTKSQKRGES